MLITPTPAGEMRYRVTVIQVAPGALDEFGATNNANAQVRTIWAKISPISGTERYVNAQNTASVTHEIRCRWVPYIDHTCKLQLGSRTFDIISALDLENQHVELVILAAEQVN